MYKKIDNNKNIYKKLMAKKYIYVKKLMTKKYTYI